MGLEQVLQWNVRLFMLIFARWAGMIMLAPVFGARGVPVAVRVVVTASISLILYPLIANSGPVVPGELFAYVGVLIKEILVGLVIGFVIYAVTAVLEGAGQLVDFDMGFTMGNMIDPVYGMQSPMMGNFQSLLATMILLSTDAHHYLIAAMVKSYTYVPINPNSLPAAPRFYIDLVGQIFALSVQLAVPVIGAILLADVGVGLLSRTVPQLNIFSVVFPLKIIFGFVLLYLAVPLFSQMVGQLFNTSLDWLLKLYREWGT